MLRFPIRLLATALATLTVTVSVVREDGYQADEILVEVTPGRSFVGSDLAWQLTIRALISLSPPEQGWDRRKDSYSTIAEPGHFLTRVRELETLVAGNELAQSEPGQHAHYAHREHLAGKTIGGVAVRALCGAYFVPTQDHDAMPCCPICQERLTQLST